LPLKPQPPQPATWSIYKVASKQTWLGTIEAIDEREAIEKAIKEFKASAKQADRVTPTCWADTTTRSQIVL
jgi:hypothetical protein